MSKIILSFGSNKGDKRQNIESAYHLLSLQLGTQTEKSSFYETKPWGFESENMFVNSVAEYETDYSPFECLDIIHNIEKHLGRVRSGCAGYEDRVIDIDILFYDDVVLDTPNLKIPHPLWNKRDFVLIPLKEIFPNFSNDIADN